MNKVVYLIRLDNDGYEWSFLWDYTIREIKKVAKKIEIISVWIPILAVETVDGELEFLEKIYGIKTIEEDTKGYYPQV